MEGLDQKEKQNTNYFVQNLESKLYRITLKNHFSKIIFVCIGTNRITGDSFGPMVGENLKSKFKNIPNIEIYGTVKEPVHFLNAQEYLKLLKNKKDCIIAIDSAFDSYKNLGNTYVNWGGMKLGKALKKELYFPANISIKTVIAEKTKSENENFKGIAKCDIKKIETLSFQVAEEIYLATLKVTNCERSKIGRNILKKGMALIVILYKKAKIGKTVTRK